MKLFWYCAGLGLLCWTINSVLFGDDGNKRYLVLDVLGFFLSLGSIAAAWINSLLRVNKYEYIEGEFNGELDFQTDRIIVNKFQYMLDEISKISLTAFDYKGQYSISSFRAKVGDAYRSNGTGNTLEIYLKSGKQIKINFEQTYKDEIQKNINELINYCNQGKLYYITILDLMRLSDYKEIQDFKKKYLKEFQ